MNLPDWLTPGTFATDGLTIFAVAKVQRAKPPSKDVVLVAANQERYPLARCRAATLTDLPKAGRFVDAHGTEVILSMINDVALLSSPAMNDVRRVHLPGLRNATSVVAAAQSLAAAFNGVIVEGDCDAA